MCILGSLTGVAATRGDVNIFTQIGFVVLVGLASKNAILIVEFAKHKKEAGLSRHEATLAACRLRLRPILMTSFAFIFGVIPLTVATGAGAEMRKRLGIAVFSGMLGVTLFGIFLTPVFFNVVEWFVDSRLAGSRRAAVVGRALLLPVRALKLAVLRPVTQLTGVLGRWRVPTRGHTPVPTANGITQTNGSIKEKTRNGDGQEHRPRSVEQK